jgi:hypothetical protein
VRIRICISALLSRRERRRAQPASSSFPQPLLHLPWLLAPAGYEKLNFGLRWWSGRAEEALERERAATAQGSTTAAGETKEAAGEDTGREGRRRLHLHRGPYSEWRPQLASAVAPTLNRDEMRQVMAEDSTPRSSQRQSGPWASVLPPPPRSRARRRPVARIGGGAAVFLLPSLATPANVESHRRSAAGAFSYQARTSATASRWI